MKKPIRTDARSGATAAEALTYGPMSDIIDALAGGRVTATALTKAYLARIAAYDRGRADAEFGEGAQPRCTRDRG